MTGNWSRREFVKLIGSVGALAVAAAALAFAPRTDVVEAPEDGAASHHWHIEATGARIIGTYGKENMGNFAYDGDNVRPLEGRAVAKIDPASGKGEVRIALKTTEASGPIHFGADTKWEGEIEIVQQIDSEKMDKARIAETLCLHGDTGNEAPVMPKIWNYFATWGPSKIVVNGEEAVPMIGSHTMFTEQARGPDGKIKRGETIYHPMKVQDKTGFTNPDELEFHYVAHTTEPDPNNFPPHTAWIHVHCSDVEVKSKPPEVQIPYDPARVAQGEGD